MSNPEKISPDDPRLTLYALGEMEATERAAFEALLAGDPSARAAVEEIRRTAALLGDALEQEPMPMPDNVVTLDSQLVAAAAILPGRDPRKFDGGGATGPESLRELSRELKKPVRGGRLPSGYYTVAGLAAAAFAVFFVVSESLNQSDRARGGALARPVESSAVPSPAAFAADGAGPVKARATPPPAEARALQLALPGAHVADRFVSTAEREVSTFPLRVGRDSYAEVREQLRRGRKPTKGAVQVAELINAFDYTWPAAVAGEAFVVALEEAQTPWSGATRLVRVAVRAVGAPGTVAAERARVRVEFAAGRVRAWRLIGFERDGDLAGVGGLSAGETLRGGDTVTALYEVLPAEGSEGQGPASGLLTLGLDYRVPGTGEMRQIARTLEGGAARFAQASADLKFATAVAAFGLVLNESPMRAPVDLDEIARWAAAGAGDDGLRREFVELVQRADAMEE